MPSPEEGGRVGISSTYFLLLQRSPQDSLFTVRETETEGDGREITGLFFPKILSTFFFFFFAGGVRYLEQ